MDSVKKNYRIIVEPISDEAKDIPEEYRTGVECGGFTLIADLGKSALYTFQSVNVIDIAHAMSRESILMQAAHIAKAMREAKQMKQSDEI